MKDFDLKKYLSNNPLHQSYIGGFSITELKQINLDDLTEADIAYGYSIVKELNLNSEVKLLDEGLKDFVKGVKDKLKGLKPTEQLLSVLFAKVKKDLPSGVNFKKFINNALEWSRKNKGNITNDSLKQYLSSLGDKQLNEKFSFGDAASQVAAGSLAALKVLLITLSLAYPGKTQANQAVNDLSGENATEVSKVVTQNTDDNSTTAYYNEFAKDIKVNDKVSDAIEAADENTIISTDTEVTQQYSTGGFDLDIDKFGDAIDDMISNDIENTEGVGEDGEGYEIDLEYSGDVSNTGANSDDPDGPATKGLKKNRTENSKKGSENGKAKTLKKYPKAKINLVKVDTQMSDTEVEVGSDEAKSQQTSKVKVTNKKEIKKADPTPEPGDDDGDGIKTSSPEDVIAFYSKKPRMDKSKYEVIFMHILPFIIGNGEDGITKSNPAFEKVIKYFGAFDENETLNDAFINRRIGTDGVLRKELKKAKGKDKEGIENAIKVLTWLRNTKKSPSSIGNFLNKLNPDLQVGKRSANKFRFQKGKETPQASKAARQAPGATKKDPNPTNMMERLVSRIKTTLLEFNSNLLPDYNETAAKTNIGHLLPIYTSIWTGENNESIPYNVDAIYVYDEKGEPSTKPEYAKSEAYFQKYFDILPKHMEDAKQTKQTKEKVDTKATTKDEKNIIYLYDLDGDEYNKLFRDSNFRSTYFKNIQQDKEEFEYKGQTYSNKDGGQAGKTTTSSTTSKGDSKSDSDTKTPKLDIEKTSKIGKDLDAIKKAIKGKSQKDIEAEKDKSATQSDYQKGNEPITPDSKEAGEELGKQKDLVTALNLINTQEELQNLIAGMLSFIAPSLLRSPQRLKTALMQAATVAYDKKGVPDSKRVKKEKSQGLKENLKSTILLSLLLEKVENKIFKDVTKVVDIINKKPSLKNRLLKINQPEELIDFILSELLEKLNDIFAEKDVDIIQALKGVATIAGAGTLKPYDSKEQVKEALTPDEATKVDSKYKEIYAGMLKNNPLKLKKYNNPDKVAYGRAIKLIQKESKILNENEKKALEALRDSLLTAFNKYGIKTNHEIDPKFLRLDFIPNTPKDFESISRSLSKRFGQYSSKPFNVLGNDYTVSLDSNVNVSGPEKGMGKIMLTLDNAVNEKKLTAAEKAKKEDIIMALKKQKGGKDKLKPSDYAYATSTAIDVAEEITSETDMEKIKDYKPIVGGDNSLQRKWAKMDPKERKKLYPKFHNRKWNQLRQHEKDQIKETGDRIARNNMKKYKEGNMKENRLTELVKAALMGPIPEKMDPVGEEDLDVNNDGKINKTDDYLANRRKTIKKAIAKKKGRKMEEIKERILKELKK